MWEKDGAFWNSVVDTWADLQKSKSLLKVSDNARLSELREAVSKLKDTPPAQPGGWPVKETILNFLTNSDPPAQ
jgi:hypothetical protein